MKRPTRSTSRAAISSSREVLERLDEEVQRAGDQDHPVAAALVLADAADRLVLDARLDEVRQRLLGLAPQLARRQVLVEAVEVAVERGARAPVLHDPAGHAGGDAGGPHELVQLGHVARAQPGVEVRDRASRARRPRRRRSPARAGPRARAAGRRCGSSSGRARAGRRSRAAPAGGPRRGSGPSRSRRRRSRSARGRRGAAGRAARARCGRRRRSRARRRASRSRSGGAAGRPCAGPCAGAARRRRCAGSAAGRRARGPS